MDINRRLSSNEKEQIALLYVYTPSLSYLNENFNLGCQFGFKTLRYLTFAAKRLESFEYELVSF